MTGKNKFLFALGVLAILLAVLSLVGATLIGFSATLTDILMTISGLLLIVLMFVILGPARLFKWIYFVIAADVVYIAVVNAITGGVVAAVIWIVVAILMILSLIPVVFKKL